MTTGDDWRLYGHDDLDGLTFRRKPYCAPPDHDHCELCWVMFVEQDDPYATSETVSEGYAAIAHTVRLKSGAERSFPDDYRWICPRCYNDFKNRFGWIVVDESGC